MTAPRTLWRRLASAVGIAAVGALALVACTPEPPPGPSRPECGSVDATAADGTAITVKDADGDAKVVSVHRGDDVDREVGRLRAQGRRVVDVAPEVPVSVAQADVDVDDPFFDAGGGGGQFGLWGVKRIDAPQAWGSAPNLNQGQGVRVAVIDTGVQGDHPGLAARVVAGADFVVGAPYDGRVDGNGHGTHVAGTIAETDDGSGGIGVAPQATIVPVRVLGCNGGGSSSAVANGIYWAVDTGQVDVINLSLGTSAQSSTILTAVQYALNHGVVVAAAAGNGGSGDCPPDSPVTTTTSTSTTTPSTTDPPVTVTASGVAPASATTAAPPTTTTVARDDTSAPSTATPASTGPAPTATTAAPPADPTEPVAAAGDADDAPVTIDAIAVPACTPTAYSNALYPAGFAIGRPGLLAVAATGLYTDLTPASSLGSGVLDWKVAPGSDVAPGTVIATVGAQQVKAQTHGVLVEQKVADGTTVRGAPVLAKVISADHRALYSNVSQYLTIAAPGGGLPSSPYGIYSTLPGSGYGYKSGTSMATPHVAGVAALILSKCPNLTPEDVSNAMTQHATDLGETGWDPAFGAGMVQADAAVAAAC